MQRYRADIADAPAANGAVAHYARWMGGPTLAKVTACPVARDLMPPRTVYVTGEADTFYSLPAACKWRGRKVTGWLGCEQGNWTFHPHRGEVTPSPLDVTITYDAVSEASAIDGATCDHGYIDPSEQRRSYANGRKRDIERNVRHSRAGRYRWTLRGALDFLKRLDGDREPWEAQHNGDSISVRVCGEYDPSNADELQATYTLHLGGKLSDGSWARIVRLLESRGARFV